MLYQLQAESNKIANLCISIDVQNMDSQNIASIWTDTGASQL